MSVLGGSMAQSDKTTISVLRAELAEHCRRIANVQRVLDAARRVSPSRTMTVYVHEVQGALDRTS